MPAVALDSFMSEKLEALYGETQVDVEGPVDSDAKSYIAGLFRRAGTAAKYAMGRHGLHPQDVGVESIKADPIEPSDGFIGGHTNGRTTAINPYMLPSTDYYWKFRDWMSGTRGKLAEYLHERYGTPARADESARLVAGHEMLHDLTQLRPMQRSDGSWTKPFAHALHGRLTERYSENLPRGLKWLAPMLAGIAVRPLVEGINEVATDEVYNGMSAFDVRRTRSGDPTTYGVYATAAADALIRMDQGEGALPYYAHWAGGGGRQDLDHYIDGFFGKLGQIYGERSGLQANYGAAPALQLCPI